MKFTNWTRRRSKAGTERTPEWGKLDVIDGYAIQVGGELFDSGSMKIHLSKRVWNKDSSSSHLQHMNLIISAADLEAAGFVRKG